MTRCGALQPEIKESGLVIPPISVHRVSGPVRCGIGGLVDATQLNFAVLLVLLVIAGVFAVLVGALSSRSLREEGLRRVIKRWLGQ
jgi:hypothetical protein